MDDVEVAGYAVNEEVSDGEVEGAGAEVDGDELDLEQVKMGRKEELEFMIKKLDMFEFGTYEEAVSRGGKQPTTTKWVDRWKADDQGGRFVRCRLVGRDFKVKGVEEREDLFAAKPPLESKKLMFRIVAAVRGQRRRGLEEVKLMSVDVKKAHLYASCSCQKCSGSMARKAAAGWEEEYAGKLESEGFRRGKGAPTMFFNAQTAVRLVVHGDDFTYSGTKKELEKSKEEMREWYVIKDRGTMGSGKNVINEVTILGRTVRWTAEGLE